VVSARDQLIHRLIDDPPALHVNEHGEALNLQIDPKLVPHLRQAVFPGAQTIETGAGISTIVLLILGAQHTSVSPDGGEADRIRAYCADRAISTDGYTHIVGRSEDVLPRLQLPDPLDLAIVDGNHAFPAPFIDWFYLTKWLKPSGVLVVDDVELWTGAMLADFLDDEKGVWSRIDRNSRFAVYRLLQDPEIALGRGWEHQPHVFANSDLVTTGLVSGPLTSRLPGHPMSRRLKRMARRAWWKVTN
jgi:Methyltransferase domain